MSSKLQDKHKSPTPHATEVPVDRQVKQEKSEHLSPMGDWQEHTRPWTARPCLPTEEPGDPHTFLDIVQDDNNQDRIDIEKRKADQDRTADREKVRKELGIE